MTDTLATTTARMLRDHFHQSGMTKETDELDAAIAETVPKENPKPPTTEPLTGDTADERHDDDHHDGG